VGDSRCDGCIWGGMKLAITRRDFVTGLAALSAGTLNSRALPILRSSSEDAGIDSGKPPDQYFETWTAQKTGITWKHDNAISTMRYLPESHGPGSGRIRLRQRRLDGSVFCK